MKILVIIIFNFFLGTVYANSEWETIDVTELSQLYIKVGAFYTETNSYYFSVKHASYSDSLASIPNETLKGFYFKEGKNFRMNVLGTEMIQVGNSRVTVLKESKELMINNALEKMNANIIDRQKTMTLFIKKVEKNQHKNFTELRIFYDERIPYSSIYMKIDANGFVTNMKMYLYEFVDWVDSDGNNQKTQPRMEISYVLNPTQIKSQKNQLKISNYVLRINKPNPLPSSQFYGYQVKDLRIN